MSAPRDGRATGRPDDGRQDPTAQEATGAAGEPGLAIEAEPDAQPQGLLAEAAEMRPQGAAATDELAPREADVIDRVVRVVLGVGLILSSLLLVAGFVAWIAGGAHVAAAVHGPISAARDLARLRPIGFFSLGLLVLILTPFARVIGTLAAFVSLRDWRYALVAAGVLTAMATALVIAVL